MEREADRTRVNGSLNFTTIFEENVFLNVDRSNRRLVGTEGEVYRYREIHYSGLF